MSTHVKGMTQKFNGTHYTPHILPIKVRKSDPRKHYTSPKHAAALRKAS